MRCNDHSNALVANELARIERPQLAARTWREQPFRRDRNAAALCAWAAPLGELTAEEREAAIIQHYYETQRALRVTFDD